MYTKICSISTDELVSWRATWKSEGKLDINGVVFVFRYDEYCDTHLSHLPIDDCTTDRIQVQYREQTTIGALGSGFVTLGDVDSLERGHSFIITLFGRVGASTESMEPKASIESREPKASIESRDLSPPKDESKDMVSFPPEFTAAKIMAKYMDSHVLVKRITDAWQASGQGPQFLVKFVHAEVDSPTFKLVEKKMAALGFKFTFSDFYGSIGKMTEGQIYRVEAY